MTNYFIVIFSETSNFIRTERNVRGDGRERQRDK